MWNAAFKDCILQILVGPFLNTLSHLSLYHRVRTFQNGLYNFYTQGLYLIKDLFFD